MCILNKQSIFIAALLIGNAILSAGTVHLPEIKLGALPVDRETSFSVNLPYSGRALVIVELDSNCPCLQIGEATDTLTAGENRVTFGYTPFDTGPATVRIEGKLLDPETGEVSTLRVPISMIGFDGSGSSGLPEWMPRVSPNEAYGKMGSYRVLDIRGPEAYEKAHIPGSFEYSLDAIIARPSLLAGPVLIVSDGLVGVRESMLLAELHASSKHIHWLDGGLPAWHRADMPVTGVWPTITNVARVSMERWLEGSRALEDRWVVVDLSQTMEGRFLGLNVVRPKGSDRESIGESILTAMEATLRLPHAEGVLVIGDARELVYPTAESARSRYAGLPVYYLINGEHGYHRWLAARSGQSSGGLQTISFSGNQLLSAPGAEHSLQSSGRSSGCASCPGRH